MIVSMKNRHSPSRRLLVSSMMMMLLVSLNLAERAWTDEKSQSDGPVNSRDATNSEKSESETKEAPIESFFSQTTVTATGTEVDVFTISTPVTVIRAEEIHRKIVNNAAELLVGYPGLDMNGVGPNQMRPIIRGQRGLRILFLENGLRMNNPRRQSDFGEITGLVPIESVETVEVVHGPASVLYGTDAIGGVLNLITKSPTFRTGSGLAGSFGINFGSDSNRRQASASLDGRQERFSYRIGLSRRQADHYHAAAGTFGEIRLDHEVPLLDSGLDDDSLSGVLGYGISDSREISLRLNRYRADQTGFGLVDPELLDDQSGVRIRILYPFQDFDRYTLGYQTSAGSGIFGDSYDIKFYYQKNKRQLANEIDINIGPIFPGAPDSAVFADTLNQTELETFGGRGEFVKVLKDRHVLTYGAEFFNDDSFNTDRSTTTTTLRFPGPPFEVIFESTDTVANAPNAKNSSYGVFLQDEILATERLKVTLGGRYQKVKTKAVATPDWDISGLDFDDDTFVGSVNMIYQVTDYLNVLGSFGSAFRAPSIIERLFNGPTPEGIGFQLLNPELTSERSENIDLGFKYRRRNAFMEAIYFQNDISDGIIQYFLSPSDIDGLAADTQDQIAQSGVEFVVQQRNIDRLRYKGLEVALGWRAATGLSIGGNFTFIDSERINSSNPPTGDAVGDKTNAYLRYETPESRYWFEYRVRRNESQAAVLDPNQPVPPVGEVLPSFTVHSLGGGVTLFERARYKHAVNFVIDNLTDELYAEFSNSTFFRPQQKRHITVAYSLQF